MSILLVLLLVARPVASLLRMNSSAGGIVLDTVNDVFNYSQELENYVELDEAALAALKGEANTVCKSYKRPYFLDRDFMSVNDTAGETSWLNASFMGSGDFLKKVCFGQTWNKNKCLGAAQGLRNQAWKHLRASTTGHELFKHLQRSRKGPPKLKTFRAGGGVHADVHCGGEKPASLYYRHIFKAAGLAITKNLAILAGEPPLTFIDANWVHHGLCHSYLKGKKKAHKGHTQEPILFTFVREPMEKFIAGYKEMAARGLIDDFRGNWVGSIAHAKLFLDNVFHGTCDNGHVLLQLQSMMGEACESRFDFIGKLEDFQDDWQKVGIMGGCSANMAWPKEHTHASDTSGKGRNAEKAMRTALAEQGGALMKTLCLWLLPDYLAFDYPLPAGCRAS